MPLCRRGSALMLCFLASIVMVAVCGRPVIGRADDLSESRVEESWEKWSYNGEFKDPVQDPKIKSAIEVADLQCPRLSAEVRKKLPLCADMITVGNENLTRFIRGAENTAIDFTSDSGIMSGFREKARIGQAYGKFDGALAKVKATNALEYIKQLKSAKPSLLNMKNSAMNFRGGGQLAVAGWIAVAITTLADSNATTLDKVAAVLSGLPGIGGVMSAVAGGFKGDMVQMGEGLIVAVATTTALACPPLGAAVTFSLLTYTVIKSLFFKAAGANKAIDWAQQQSKRAEELRKNGFDVEIFSSVNTNIPSRPGALFIPYRDPKKTRTLSFVFKTARPAGAPQNAPTPRPYLLTGAIFGTEQYPTPAYIKIQKIEFWQDGKKIAGQCKGAVGKYFPRESYDITKGEVPPLAFFPCYASKEITVEYGNPVAMDIFYSYDVAPNMRESLGQPPKDGRVDMKLQVTSESGKVYLPMTVKSFV